MTPENSQPAPHDPFDDIIAGLDTKHDDSYENQESLFQDIKRRHEAARQDAEITRVAIDKLPMEAIGTAVEINLTRRMIDRRKEGLFLRINYPSKSERTGDYVINNVFVTVGERMDGKITPRKEFSEQQAALVFSQADELKDLKAEGFLPNLSADLASISDPSKAISNRPPMPEG